MNSKPKRRWTRFFVPRYSLRTLLILVTVITVALGYHVHKVREQKRAVAWVMEQGGTVKYEYVTQDAATGVVKNDYGWEPEFLRDLLGDDFFYDVLWVDISGTEKGDLSKLASLTGLKILSIESRELNDLTPLASFTNLALLSIDCRQVNDLSPLSSLTNLEMLTLSETSVSDLSPLASLKNLKRLDIFDPKITKEEIEELKKALPQCRIKAFFSGFGI